MQNLTFTSKSKHHFDEHVFDNHLDVLQITGYPGSKFDFLAFRLRCGPNTRIAPGPRTTNKLFKNSTYFCREIYYGKITEDICK